jgi:NADH dehydrogenase FAD-containing subunit
MGPGMLGGFYPPEDIRFPVKEMAESRGAAFVKGRVSRVDPENRTLILASDEEIVYDVVSFNVGSGVPVNIVSNLQENILTVKPIENLLKGRKAILDLLKREKSDIVVVGGGPAALEVSGNICKLTHENRGTSHISLLAGKKLLGRFPQKAQRIARDSLVSRGVEVIDGSRVSQINSGEAFLEDGRRFSYDLCFLAVGVKPSTLFENSGVPVGTDGGLLVNEFLQSVAYPEVFGGGDCICFQPQPLDKVGVYATRQNPILYRNLMAALEGNPFEKFDPGGKYLLIFNLGDGRGVFRRGSWVWAGKPAFWLKNYIDKRFMRKFQGS